MVQITCREKPTFALFKPQMRVLGWDFVCRGSEFGFRFGILRLGVRVYGRV
jgi:hypothetical protein